MKKYLSSSSIWLCDKKNDNFVQFDCTKCELEEKCEDNYEKNESGVCEPKKCSISEDCNNNAESVSGNKINGCSCTCNNFYTGVKCDNLILCNINDNCNGNAVSVEGNLKDGCTCQCKNNYFCDL